MFKFEQIKKIMNKIQELEAKIAELQKELESIKQEESKYIDFSANENWGLGSEWKDENAFYPTSIQIRGGGEFKNKGFYLTSAYNWEIVRDSEEELVLLPTKR